MCPSIRAMAKPDHRPVALIVVLAVVVGRIAEDGVAADDVERQRLAGQSRRSGHGDGAGHAVGKPRGPGQHHVTAQRSADHGPQPFDAQVIDQPPLHFDDVADGDGGKFGGIAPARGRDRCCWAPSCRGSRRECWDK